MPSQGRIHTKGLLFRVRAPALGSGPAPEFIYFSHFVALQPAFQMSQIEQVRREPRGIGFLEYTNPKDAEDAIYGLDRKVFAGKEVGCNLPSWRICLGEGLLYDSTSSCSQFGKDSAVACGLRRSPWCWRCKGARQHRTFGLAAAAGTVTGAAGAATGRHTAAAGDRGAAAPAAAVGIGAGVLADQTAAHGHAPRVTGAAAPTAEVYRVAAATPPGVLLWSSQHRTLPSHEWAWGEQKWCMCAGGAARW